MSNNMLIDELHRIQIEYRSVLETALTNIYKKESSAIIDEIGVFWERNKKVVQCILRYLFPPFEGYVFTSATILDLDDSEHYPFISLGKFHFWDDPLYKYVTMLQNTEINKEFDQKMRIQIISTIGDNIKIVNQAFGIIYILPIRLITEANQLAHEAATKAFFSLFKDELDFTTYKNNFKTIIDVKKGLSVGEKHIILLDGEDATLDLETRFRKYKETTVLPLSSDASDAEIFWFGVYSYLLQAFDTILVSLEHKLIPYIRYEVAFKYIVKISGNFGDNEELSDMLLKCIVAHLLHHNFDKQIIDDIDFREYYKAVQSYGIEKKIFGDIKQKNLGLSSMSLRDLTTIIDNTFESFFTRFHEERINP
ncbi:hypothetical protein E5161_18515 [Cohnella pontilimi]|uniref:Uncharacterized protein n=1 Tax=Cohnella pontilimi TaxID=2564100 RepID=A0A4V5LRR5_9BACL|nr:hypothetical protein [Cohnella pontilimi]TJY39569.1 hypothetical protein E5161_18515 [Cohnella pontilimi]